jgi:hypothetical protein
VHIKASVEKWLGLALLTAGCQHPAQHAATPANNGACASLADRLRTLGDDVRTIDIKIHDALDKCEKSPRHVSVVIDGNIARKLDWPCASSTKQIIVSAPPASHDGGQFVVAEGEHTVEVRDEDLGHADSETFSVPHVEVNGLVGNYVDVWIDAAGVSVRGPRAIRVPGL